MTESLCHNCGLNDTNDHYFFNDKLNRGLPTIAHLCTDCWEITYEGGVEHE